MFFDEVKYQKIIQILFFFSFSDERHRHTTLSSESRENVLKSIVATSKFISLHLSSSSQLTLLITPVLLLKIGSEH